MTRTAPKKANSRVTRIELPEKKMPRRLKSLTSPNTDFNGQVSPMERLAQPWKLCRSFGSQPVGSVVGPRWPEAGMAAQVIPSQSSRWTFRPGQSPTADLPTCRPADLPTCRPGWRMTTGATTRSLSALAAVQAFPLSSNTNVEDIAPRRSSRPRQPFQGPTIVRASPRVLLVRSIFFNSPFPNGNREEPQNTHCYQ